MEGSTRFRNRIKVFNEFIFLKTLIFLSLSAIFCLALSPAALTALISLQVVLMNLFVTKQITLFGLHATSSDALGIGAVLGINLLREYCGAKQAGKAVLISFISVTFYTIISWLQLKYVPALADTQQPHLVALLAPMPRILAASLFSYIIVQSLEYWLYDRLQKKFHGAYFILRNYGVVLFTQLIDTILFTLLGLSGIVDDMSQIIIVSYGIKAVTIFSMTPMLAACKKILDWTGYAPL